MANTTVGGLSRVTIVAPQTRVDLALPSDVPLADLLPTVLRYAGEHLADEPTAQHGWGLARLGGPAFEVDRSMAQLRVHDGEVLYLRPRDAGIPEPIFDDIVDAVATATRDRSGRWLPTTTRTFGVAAAVTALVAGALMLALAGGPGPAGALVSLAVAAVLIAAATALSRVGGDSRLGVVFGVVALCYVAAGGLLLFAGDGSAAGLAAPQVLLAGVAILLASAIVAVGVADGAAVFLGASVAAAALCLGATICLLWQTTPAAAAAMVGAAAFAAVPMMPMLSYRLAGLPVPSVPVGADDLKADVDVVEGTRVLVLSDRADQLLGGLVGALAVIGGCAALALTLTGGAAGTVLSSVLGLLMLTRARWFVGRRQRMPLLISGAVTLGLVGAALYVAAGPVLRLAVALPVLLLVAAALCWHAVSVTGGPRSPLWARAVDVFEVVLFLSVVPLAVWASGMYGWIRSFRDG